MCLSLNNYLDRSKAAGYTHIAFSVSPKTLQKFRQNIKQLNLKLWQENTSEGDSLYILDPDNHQLELHVGNWQTRLWATKQDPYADMIFYDLP